MEPRRLVSASIVLAVFAIGWGAGAEPARAGGADPASKPELVRDRLWVWGNPGMTEPGKHTAATFAQASPQGRARMLGVPNIIMAGSGLPHDRAKAARLTREAAAAPHLVWEVVPDGQKDSSPPFVFKRRIADIEPLVKKHPRIEAVLLDDMTSVAASKGFKPKHIRGIRSLIKEKALPLKIWGVLYTMNFPKPITDSLVNELDVINLWTWHAKDTVHLEKNVAECEKRYPGKPIVVGLYLYDYGNGRRMPMDLHERQCETALKLLHTKRVQGIVFLTITNDERAVQWTIDWVKRVGGQKIGKP